MRNTGSQAFWLRIVPNPPGEAPIRRDRLAAEHARDVRWAGRDSQSTAFFSTPGIELLYSGVTKQQAVGRGDPVLQRLDGRRQALGGLDVAVVRRECRGSWRCSASTPGGISSDGGAQERAVERGLDEGCRTGR